MSTVSGIGSKSSPSSTAAGTTTKRKSNKTVANKSRQTAGLTTITTPSSLLETTTSQIVPNSQMDLAPRGPSVVQLRPVRPVFSTLTPGKTVGGSVVTPQNSNASSPSTVSTPIISVNRSQASGNLTLIPTRPQGLVGVAGIGVTTTGGVGQNTTYQLARLTTAANVRPAASITVTPLTPLSTSTLSANIRLTGTTVSNGAWLGGSGTPIRAATITVGGRAVRPTADGKMIHIPQHVTQLQMVDNKVSILKPQLTTPIVNIRGTLPGGATSGGSVTLPITPFTIRAANITSISALQRPPISTSSPSSIPVHKVITPAGQGAPIQFVNSKNVLQTLTPIPKLCLTLSTNANLPGSNSSPPVVAVASRPAASLTMTPSGPTGGNNNSNATSTTTNALPITKVFPVVGRDGSGPNLVENILSSSSGSSAVSVSTVSLSSTTTSSSSQPQHVLVHTTTPTINVHTHPNASNPNPTTTGLPTSFFVDKNFQMNLQTRPISLENKKIDPKSLPPGSMIIAAGSPNTVSIPLIPSTAQHLNITHLSQPPGNTQVINSTTTTASSSTTTTTTTGGNSGNSSSSKNSNNNSANQNHLPQQFIAQIPIINSSSGVGLPTITITPSSSTPGQTIPISIPAHIISQSIGIASSSSINTAASILTVTTTTISSSTSSSTITAITTSNNSSGGVGTSTTATTTTGSSSASLTNTTTTSSSTSLASSSTSTTSTTTTTAQSAQSPNHNNQQQNSNTKATHSPRPSILRKRELVGDHHHPNKAQRNLSLHFSTSNNSSSNFTGSSNKENSLSSITDKFSNSSSTITTTTTISNLGSGCGSTSGVSILKKEFQPPTEESSWQSVSSNSSSGSSTISTTSETAELQLQQQQLSGGVDLSTSLPLHPPSEISGIGSAFVGVGLGSVLNSATIISGSGKSTISSNNNNSSNINIGGTCNLTSSVGGGLSLGLLSTSSSNNNSSNNHHHHYSSTTTSQNGVLKSSQARSRSSSTSKGGNRDIDRLKNKDKDSDSVSPRKKPRKQQLTSSDLLEAASPEIYYQGKGKRFRKGDLSKSKMNFTEQGIEKERTQADNIILEDPPPLKTVFYVKRRNMSLIHSNSIPPKNLTTHFQRYSDVKSKEEKRPTISEIANQKNVIQKVSGWRVQHMTAQMEELVDGETNVVNRCSSLLSRLENKAGPSCTDRDLNIVMELLKGNIQRCKVIRDQMSESRAQALKILEHKTHVTEVINKYTSKRSKKNRERL